MSIVGLLLVLALGSVLAGAETKSAIVTIKVEGMDCDGCASSLEKKLKATDGVEEVRVSFPKKEAWIKYDDQKLTVAKLREVINSTGYQAVGEISDFRD